MAKKFPKIGLALSAGGARGIAQIAVIEELEKAGIPIDIIAGSSAGAVVGACCGLGTLPELKKWLLSVRQRDIWQFFDLDVSKEGLIKGHTVARKIKELTAKKKLEESKIRLGIVTTDLKTGKAYVFQKGKPSIAVRASMTMPLLLQPVKIGGRFLLDGGLSQYLPAETCYQMGADFVVGVDCSLKNGGVWEKIFKAKKNWQTLSKYLNRKKNTNAKKKKDFNFLTLLSSSLDIFNSQDFYRTKPKCDYLIKINLKILTLNIYQAKEALQEGESLGREAAREIKQLLKEKYGVKTA